MIRGVLWRHSTLTPWSRPSNFAGLIIQYVMFGINFLIVWHLRLSYKQLGSEKFFEDGFMIMNVVISVLLLVALCISIEVGGRAVGAAPEVEGRTRVRARCQMRSDEKGHGRLPRGREGRHLG